jgi:hypothetical protein
MNRTSLVRASTIAAAILVVAAVPAAAMIIELGQTKTALVAPTCPPGTSAKNCTIILNNVTALETIRDGTSYPTKVKKSGWLVAWSVGLSILSTDQTTEKTYIHNLDSNLGGTTRAQIVVLKSVGAHRLFKWKMVAAGPVVHLQPYMGEVAQFVLPQPIRVVKGETLGLNVPTWAAVLSIQLSPKTFAYRQSRSSKCAVILSPATAVNQALNQTTVYGCDFPGTRVEYSATEVVDPVQSNPVH